MDSGIGQVLNRTRSGQGAKNRDFKGQWEEVADSVSMESTRGSSGWAKSGEVPSLRKF